MQTRLLHALVHSSAPMALGLCFALAGCQAEVGDESQEEGPSDETNNRFHRAAEPVGGKYIVVLEQNRTQSLVPVTVRAEALAAQYSAVVHLELEGVVNGFVAEMNEEDAIALSQDSEVAWVEEDGIVHLDAVQTGVGFGLDRIDQFFLPLNGQYTFTRTGAGVHAYVIDSGMRTAHASFGGRIGRGGFAIQDGRGVEDCNGHGTHVAGIIGSDQFGVAKAVTLHPIRVFDCTGSGATSNVISGINFAVSIVEKPAVFNLSVGTAASAAMDQAVRNAIAQGITVVASAGNDARDACLQSPARVPEALTVASSDPNDVRSSFSNFGSCVDLFAPGRNIRSAGIASNTATAVFSGTSQAAPHVAGVVALFLQNIPTASPSLVQSTLTAATAPGRIGDLRGSPNRLLNTAFVGGNGN